MPHTTQWIVEKRVLYSQFQGIIGAEELAEFINEVRDLIHEGTPTVYHISDSLQLERVTFTLRVGQKLLPNLRTMRQLGWQVDINTNPMNRMFARILSQFSGVQTHTVSSLDDAISFLKHKDDTLRAADWQVPPITDDTSDTQNG